MSEEFISVLKELKYFINTRRPIKKIAIFGTIKEGTKAYNILKSSGIEVVNFFDNDKLKHNKELFGLAILDPALINKNTSDIVIASQWCNDIAQQIKSVSSYQQNIYTMLDFNYTKPFSEDDVNSVTELYHHLLDNDSKEILISILKYRLNLNPIKLSNYKQYFHPIVRVDENDVIIDGGAYDGDTIRDFKLAGYNNLEIHSFEPDDNSYKKLIKEKDNSCFKIFTVKKGLFDKDTTLRFSSFSQDDHYDDGAKIDKNGDIVIETTTIDSYCLQKNIAPNFIKLDIEGSEIHALTGAKNIIQKYKPKLAICVYHEYDHLWTIYNLIKTINKDYKFYLGHHHANSFYETVLYAKQ